MRGSAKAVKSDGHGMRVISQSPDHLARMPTMTDHADWQTRAAGAARPRPAVFDRVVRALLTFGAGAGGGAGGDVRARGFDTQGEGDHRRAVRPQLLGLVDQRNQPAAGCESGTICRPCLGRVPRAISLPGHMVSRTKPASETLHNSTRWVRGYAMTQSRRYRPSTVVSGRFCKSR